MLFRSNDALDFSEQHIVVYQWPHARLAKTKSHIPRSLSSTTVSKMGRKNLKLLCSSHTNGTQLMEHSEQFQKQQPINS